MVTIRPFNIFDTFDYNNINLDILTETVKYIIDSSTPNFTVSTS